MFQGFQNYWAEFLILWASLSVLIPILAIVYILIRWSVASSYSLKKLSRAVAGKHVLITGGSKGLGEALGIEMAKAGAHVSIAARGELALKSACGRIQQECKSHQKVSYFVVDLTDQAKVSLMMEQLKDRVGVPDWVICNAGAAEFGFLTDSTQSNVAEWMMNINYFGSLNVLRALFNTKPSTNTSSDTLGETLPKIDRVILVGSVLSLISYTGCSAYSSSKYAIRGLADSLRSEFLPSGTKVHAYFPANMDTPGLVEENKNKPAITAAIEGTVSTMTSTEAAQRCLANVLSERFYITNDALGELIRVCVSGSAPRPTPIAEILASPLVALVFAIWSAVTDAQQARRPLDAAPKKAISLPGSILAELGVAPSLSNSHFHHNHKPNRRDLRKQSRDLKKQHKATNVHKKFVKPLPVSKVLNVVSKPMDKGIAKPMKPMLSKPTKPMLAKPTNPVTADKQDKAKQERQLQKLAESNPGFYSLLRDSNLINDLPVVSNSVLESAHASRSFLSADEKNIQILEKKLKLKDGKLDKGFVDDGLDYLLQGIVGDTLVGSDSDLEFDRVPSDSDMEFDRDQSDDSGSDVEFECEETLGDSESDVELSRDEKEENDDSEMELEMDHEEMVSDVSSMDEMQEDLASESSGESQEMLEMEKKVSNNEIIQGERYIPPHLRPKKAESEDMIRLKRHVQGLLNRLSDGNIEGIVTSIDEVYRNNPRQYVTEAITSILLAYVGDHSNLLESFVASYAAFVAALHNIVGLDFGAFLVQSLFEKFDAARNELASNPDEQINKRSTNFLVFLAYLYNFQVLSCVLVYDLVRLFLSDLDEVNVEFLLKVLKISGHQLRLDDALAMKDIVLMVKQVTSTQESSSMSIRQKFMIETIMDLKNNRKKTGFGNTTQLQEERLSKLIQNMIKRRSLYGVEPLRVSLEDIRAVDTKGKWWLVGAAWSGHDSSKIQSTVKTESASSELLAQAKLQKMNTDIRRSIFVILMSSEDCVDAFEKLLKLGLKDKQERDIVRVILHCCSQEKVFNPYYALVATQFCEFSHGFKITFQYAFWDSFKAMAEESEDEDGFGSSNGVRKTVHLARFFAFMVSRNSLPLSILKVFDFSISLPSPQLLFLRHVFGYLCVQMPQEGFMKLCRGLKSQASLGGLSDGLSLFFKINLMSTLRKGECALMGVEKEQANAVFDTLKAARKMLQ